MLTDGFDTPRLEEVPQEKYFYETNDIYKFKPRSYNIKPKNMSSINLNDQSCLSFRSYDKLNLYKLTPIRSKSFNTFRSHDLTQQKYTFH